MSKFKTILSYKVSCGTNIYYVQLGHLEEFVALFQGETIIVEPTFAWRKYPLTNGKILQWYEKEI